MRGTTRFLLTFSALAIGATACEDGHQLATSPADHLEAGFAKSGATGARSNAAEEHRREPFSTSVTACNDDQVALAGTLHMRLMAFANPADRVHFQLHTNLQDVNGVGVPSGMHYRLIENHIVNYNYAAFDDDEPTGSYVTAQSFRSRLVPNRTGDSREITVRLHITINGQTEPVVSWFTIEGGCGR